MERSHPKEGQTRFVEPREDTLGKPNVWHKLVILTATVEGLLHAWWRDGSIVPRIRELYHFFLARVGISWWETTDVKVSKILTVFDNVLTSVVRSRIRVRCKHLGFVRKGEKAFHLSS